MIRTYIAIAIFGFFVLPRVGIAQDATSSLAAGEPKLTASQLDDLVAPIALYPDPLIAIILPASTVPTDIVLAARYLRDGKDADQIDNQNWDPSVKALARYPDVLNTMDENLDWTNQLGAAVIAQQDDVMQAIQTQRAKANALGNLTTTPQQQVLVENQIIQIVPADPQIIYVPQYNPQVVYVQQAPPLAPFISFGLGFAMGAWLTNDCDWYHHRFYVNSWGPGGWHGYSRHSYNNNVNININNNYWKPNPNRPPPRPPYNPNRPGGGGANTPPAFRPPPSGGWNGGNGGGNRPGGGSNSGGNNRPGGGSGGNVGGSRPTFPKVPPTAGGGNGAHKPGQGGNGGNNRPGVGNGGKPGGGNGETKPAPAKPTTRPSTPQNKPPNLGGQNNRFDRTASKPNHPATPQPRPAQRQPAREKPAAAQPHRPAAQAKPAAQPRSAAAQGAGAQRPALSR
jgi:hypothetical protein